MQNAKPTLRSESRGQTCLHYAEPRGGKACVAGLTPLTTLTPLKKPRRDKGKSSENEKKLTANG